MAIRTWDGSSSNLWNVDANWVENSVPSAGDNLVFPASASNKSTSNDIAADTSFNSITFDGIGYTLAGNRITLVAGIIQSVTGTTNVISLAIILGATQTVNMQNAGGTLTISGIISDGGSAYGIDKTGAGQLTLSGVNTFTGGLTIKAGTVSLTTSTAAAGTGTITLGDSTSDAVTLKGDGRTFANAIALANIASHTGTITISTSASGCIFSGGVAGSNNFSVSPGGSAQTIGFSTGSIDNAGTITNINTGTGGVSISSIIGTNVTGVIQNSATSSLSLSGNNANFGSAPGNGAVTIKAGTVQLLTFAKAAGSGTITIGDTSGSANATLIGVPNITHTNLIAVASGSSGTSTITGIGSSGAAAFSGAITLSKNLTVNTSTLTTGSLTFSGAISGAGNIIIDNDSTGSILFNGVAGSVNNTGTITNSGSGSNTNNISGIIGSNVTGIVQNSATSALTLSNAANDFAGTVTVSAGTLNVTQNNEFNIVCDGAANCSIDLNDRNVGTITINKDTTAATVTLLDGWMADSFTLTQGTLVFDSVGNTLTTTTAGGGTGNWTIGANGQVDPTNLDGWTWAVGGNLSLAGDAVADLNLVATAAWTLTVTGTAVATYVDAAYSDADAGTLIDADDGTNTDSGNNLGWNFGVSETSSSSSSLSASSISPSSLSSGSSQSLSTLSTASSQSLSSESSSSSSSLAESSSSSTTSSASSQSLSSQSLSTASSTSSLGESSSSSSSLGESSSSSSKSASSSSSSLAESSSSSSPSASSASESSSSTPSSASTSSLSPSSSSSSTFAVEVSTSSLSTPSLSSSSTPSTSSSGSSSSSSGSSGSSSSILVRGRWFIEESQSWIFGPVKSQSFLAGEEEGLSFIGGVAVGVG